MPCLEFPPMKLSRFSRTSIIASVLAGCVILCALYAMFIGLGTVGRQGGLFATAEIVLTELGFIAFGAVGALIMARQPRNSIGWLMILIASVTLLQVIPPPDTVQQTTQSGGAPSPLVLLLAWVSGWSWWLLIGPLLLIPVLFPNGGPPSPRWRWVIAALGAVILIFLFMETFSVQWQDTNSGVTMVNPIGFIPADLTTAFFDTPWTILLGGITLLCVSAILVRYRRANSIERQQIKWLLFACAFFLIVYLIPGHDEDEATLPSKLLGIAFEVAILGIPISIGIAILRYRLFDIDVIIRRTLTYALVTALLLIVFFGSIILLQQLFSSMTGSGQNEIVTVLSTLAIAALFVPVRNRIQTEIDKRFNRKKYDAQKVLSDFATTVRDETDLEKLTGRLMQVVDETMQPRSVSVWLKRGTRDKG